MFYRTNLHVHQQRVHFLVSQISDLAAERIAGFDAQKAEILALVHDDAEVVTGDIPLFRKLRMTETQKAEHDTLEQQAIEKLALQRPAMIHGYAYKELLLSALKKQSVEAQVVSYMDKLDAFCEAIHEVLAGNPYCFSSLQTYPPILLEYPSKYPLIAPLLTCDHPLFRIQDIVMMPMHGHVFKIPESALVVYHFWKELTLAKFPNGQELLTKKIEY